MPLAPEPIDAATEVVLSGAVLGGHSYVALEPIEASTDVELTAITGGTLLLDLDPIAAVTDVDLSFIGGGLVALDPIDAVTEVFMTITPDLSENPPIPLALELTGSYRLVPAVALW